MMLPFISKGMGGAAGGGKFSAIKMSAASAAAAAANTASSSGSSIKRVVSCFILSGGNCRDTLRIAVFHRVATMPTFPNHWAACSGSIETGETPWQTACRELMEETNLTASLVDRQYGLYVDVPYVSRKNESSIIRVYPFTARISNASHEKATGTSGEPRMEQRNTASSAHSPPPPPPALELRGTEHDRYQWVSVNELEALEPAVPALARAFHHATFGRFLRKGTSIEENDFVVSPAMRTWASDKVNGAATMTSNAVDLLLKIRDDDKEKNIASRKVGSAARLMAMFRPSMVSITIILAQIETHQLSLDHAVERLMLEAQRVVDHAVEEILPLLEQKRNPAKEQSDKPGKIVFCIATFSRSSTILSLLRRLVEATSDSSNKKDKNEHEVCIEVICGRSTPGNEGEIMARDVGSFCKVTCLDDDELERRLRLSSNGNNHGQSPQEVVEPTIDLFLVGSDCVMSDQVVNKVGTLRMAAAAKQQQQQDDSILGARDGCLVYCCSDRFKLWDDMFPPPLEDIFECIPIAPYFDRVLIPPQRSAS